MTYIPNIKNPYLELNSKFYSIIETKENTHSNILYLNESHATNLGIPIDYLKSEEGLLFLSGNKKLDKAPFAQAYMGHQFGHLSMLGDGRAKLIGELHHHNTITDIHLKGSGRTPYSRRGDGKATLKSVLKEYIYSEAMHYLNVPTTRTLAVLKTNEKVIREQPNDGAILVRTAKSHIRVGSFEFASNLQDIDALTHYTDYTINRHLPHLNDKEDKYLRFFKEVINKQAELIATWQSIGFVHGVLNTDNVLISGETIDYGPCAFLNEYNPNAVYSSIDTQGRYRYNNQPYITSWNLSRLAISLIPLISNDKDLAVSSLNEALKEFEHIYYNYYYNLFFRKLGLTDNQDKKIVDDLLLIMESEKLDFTNTFAYLSNERKISNSPIFNTWYDKWQKMIHDTKKQSRLLMQSVNPVLIPRNKLVENAINNIIDNQDFELFDIMLQSYKRPYNYQTRISEELLNDVNDDTAFVTYCGT